MNRRYLVSLAVGAALVVPATAAAKGPSSASVSGPGLDRTLTITGIGEGPGTALGDLADEAGFFPAAFAEEPNPLLPHRPAGKLGPRLTIRYVVPGGANETYRIRQDAYPYAEGGAVTYMRPGQPIFGTTTHGGWYRAYGLRRTLVRHGLRATAVSSERGTRSSSSLALVAGIGIPGALVVLGAGAFLARRQRSAGP